MRSPNPVSLVDIEIHKPGHPLLGIDRNNLLELHDLADHDALEVPSQQ